MRNKERFVFSKSNLLDYYTRKDYKTCMKVVNLWLGLGGQKYKILYFRRWLSGGMPKYCFTCYVNFCHCDNISYSSLSNVTVLAIGFRTEYLFGLIFSVIRITQVMQGASRAGHCVKRMFVNLKVGPARVKGLEGNL